MHYVHINNVRIHLRCIAKVHVNSNVQKAVRDKEFHIEECVKVTNDARVRNSVPIKMLLSK